MFIRDKKCSPKGSQVVYHNYSIVETKKIGNEIKQLTVLTLGPKFDLDPKLWTPLTRRIEKILNKQPELFSEPMIEELAQDLATKIQSKAKRNDPSENSPEKITEFVQKPKYNFNSLNDVIKKDSRTFGVGYVALHAMERLNFKSILEELGFSEENAKIAMAIVAARMEYPASESETFKMLSERSGIGELLGINFSLRSVMCLHRVADMLIKIKDRFEKKLSQDQINLFNLENSVLLYDLTNSYFHGKPESEKAKRGHSKQKRSDCLLESMAIIVDKNDYIRKSLFYPGNVSEPKTLKEILDIINPPKGTTLVMDRGIATEANIELVNNQDYLYFVGNRKLNRDFDYNHQHTVLKTSSGKMVKMYQTEESLTTEKGEVKELWLHCHSEDRKEKETGINKRKVDGYEDVLKQLNTVLANSKKPTLKSEVMRRIGRLQEKYKVSRHFKIKLIELSLEKEMTEPFVTGITYDFEPIVNTKITHPGAYIIRTNKLNLTDSDIWNGYTKLTDIESVFETLKSELGFRPNYHHKEWRIDCHYFISVLAYQCVNYIRSKLKSKDIRDSWKTISRDLSSHCISTISINTTNRGQILTRKSYPPANRHARIYDALGISSEIDVIKLPM
jgi:hypothetical protein